MTLNVMKVEEEQDGNYKLTFKANYGTNDVFVEGSVRELVDIIDEADLDTMKSIVRTKVISVLTVPKRVTIPTISKTADGYYKLAFSVNYDPDASVEPVGKVNITGNVFVIETEFEQSTMSANRKLIAERITARMQAEMGEV